MGFWNAALIVARPVSTVFSIWLSLMALHASIRQLVISYYTQSLYVLDKFKQLHDHNGFVELVYRWMYCPLHPKCEVVIRAGLRIAAPAPCTWRAQEFLVRALSSLSILLCSNVHTNNIAAAAHVGATSYYVGKDAVTLSLCSLTKIRGPFDVGASVRSPGVKCYSL